MASENVTVCNKDIKENLDYSNPQQSAKEVYSRKRFLQNLSQCYELGLKDYCNDFYIVCLNYPDELMPERIIFQFIARRSKPTPHWHQNVFYVDKNKNLQLAWSLPHKQTPDKYLDERQKADKKKFLSNSLFEKVLF